ncbi:MAG TPA: CerR family C-terminal domain-containing protein [Acidobacteriota bacterium]|jgi:AcrR family transcriptional regulator
MVADRTRSKLLEAAREVFAERGYYRTTIRQICSHARTNIAAVNYHFGGKLGLYTAVLRQSVGSAQNEAIHKAFDQDAAPEEILRQVIRARLNEACGSDRFNWRFRLMVHELAQPTPAMSRVIDETMRPIYNRLRELVGAIIHLPRDHEKTRLCTHSIIGQVAHYAHSRRVLARLWPELKMTPEQLEKIANHIAEFSLAYLRAASSVPPRNARHGRRK